MAISVGITECRGTGREAGQHANVPELPYLAFRRVTSANAYAFQNASTRIITLKNKASGDQVWFLVQLVTSSAQADANTGILLEPGERYSFALPKGANATLYEIDIRTAS